MVLGHRPYKLNCLVISDFTTELCWAKLMNRHADVGYGDQDLAIVVNEVDWIILNLIHNLEDGSEQTQA